jgi:lysozyme
MTSFAPGVEKLLLPRPREELNENMFGALVSFAFNCGLGNLQKSTLLQRVNARDYAAATSEFLKWNKAAGKVLRGLTRRRQSEANLWCSFPNPVVKA